MKISKIVEDNKNSIIQLVVEKDIINNQKRISIIGTGFIITNDGKFITCAHVYNQIIESEKEYLVARVPGEEKNRLLKYDTFKVQLLDIDNENDVAIFKILSDQKRFRTINGFTNPDFVQEGDAVVFIGYPLATELLRMGFNITLSTNSCIISSIKRRANDSSLHYFMIDTHTNPGASGSPIFLETSGKVIGIVCGNISNKVKTSDNKEIMVPTNMGICRPATYIENIINKNINK